MTPLNLVLVLISESSAIVGQIFFKHAMNDKRLSRRVQMIAIGAASMAVGFFVWLALLAKYELSYLFPFDALDRIVLVVAAGVFLKEKAKPQLWLGVILITAGVLIVSGT